MRADARRAFSQSVLYDIEPEAISGLIDAFARSGELQWAIELGSIARTVAGVHRDGRVARSMIAPLLALHDAAGVLDLLGEWDWEGWPAEPRSFYEDAAAALYETGAWSMLNRPLLRIRRGSGVRGLRMASFFSGMTSYARGQNREAIKLLSNYVEEEETWTIPMISPRPGTPWPTCIVRTAIRSWNAKRCARPSTAFPTRMAMRGCAWLSSPCRRATPDTARRRRNGRRG